MESRDHGGEDRLDERTVGLGTVYQALMRERPDDEREGRVEIEVGMNLTAELSELHHRSQRSPSLLDQCVEERLELSVALGCIEEDREQVERSPLFILEAELLEEVAEVAFERTRVGGGVWGQAALRNRHQQGLFGAEVSVEGGTRHSGTGGHLLEGDALDALVEEELGGGLYRGVVSGFTTRASHRTPA